MAISKAYIVVGLGFGDEGKGALVDSLARQHDPERTLVVRYSGGCQAGHNVQLPYGRRHCFSQFGAGTFHKCQTFLTDQVIIDPLAMKREAAHLIDLGCGDVWSLLTVDPSCLLTTPYHQAKNIIFDALHGHGTCGMGVGAAREYFLRYGADAPIAEDLNNRAQLTDKLTLLRERLLAGLDSLRIERADVRDAYESLRTRRPANIAKRLCEAASDLELDNFHNAYEFSYRDEVVIFEGAQGVLLDERAGFHPHTTWSTVTAEGAHCFMERLEEFDNASVQTIGCIRAYHTRHGRGPFPTGNLPHNIQNYDIGNSSYSYQGEFRAGPLDLPLLNYALKACPVDQIAVSCLDHLLNREIPVCTDYVELDVTAALLEPKWTLAGQSDITDALNKASPIINYAPTVEDLLSEISSLRPIHSITNGPTYLHREWRAACA